MRKDGVLAWVAGVALGLLVAGCGHDPADREYLAALRGQETGMSLEAQMAHLEAAIRIAPGRAQYYETRAGYWIHLRQFDRALADLDRDVALFDRPYARYLRALVRCQAGDPLRALADFDTAIARQPANTQFYRGRSLARSATGDPAGALADAEHLVAVVPQQAESHYARGVARVLLDRDLEALADFDRAAAMRPELVYVIELRVATLERLGDRTRARHDRDLAARLRYEQAGCAPCLDPFRY